MLQRTNERDSRRRVLRTLHGLPGRSAVSWNRQDSNKQNKQRVRNIWSVGTGLGLISWTQM